MAFWTRLHAMTVIPAFMVFLGCAVVLARIFRNETETMKLLPIRIIAVVLVFIEIIKQWQSAKDGYSLYHLPFHFCSMFVFLFPVFAFYMGKHKQEVRIFTVVACMMLFMFMLLAPNTIYSDTSISEFFTDFFSFHTVFFHNIVILGFFYIVAVGLYDINTLRDYKAGFVLFSIYSAIACVMSQVLKENFNSFYTCKLDALEVVRQNLVDKIDWVGQLIYVFCLYALTVLFGLLCYWLFRWGIKLIKIISDKLKRDGNVNKIKN